MSNDMMTISDIYQLYQNASGSSGRGNSWYSVAANCGRKARLEDEDRAARQGGPDAPPRDAEDYFAVGTAYHLFHQLAATTDFTDMVLDMTDTRVDGAFLEGLRLFRGWTQLWGSAQAKYGQVISTEQSLESAEGTFDGPYTGRMDCLIDIQDLEGVRLRTGLQLPEPGQYVVDWKSAKGANANDAFKFTMGTQGRGYLGMYPQAKGMIFDVLFKVQAFRHEPKIAATGKVIAGKSYQHFLQLPQPDDKQVTGALVKIGKFNYDNNLANPSQCLSQYKPCAYLLNGRCGGF